MPANLIISTFPDIATARQIGTELVSRQLAACVNLIPSAESIYRWEGEVKNDSEVVAILKTTDEAFPALEAALADLHPYDVPEIIAVPIEKGSAAYLDWISSSVAGRS